MPRTAGEELFEEYLRERAIFYEYESGSKSRRPDYMLRIDPNVFCEVKDFELSPQDRAEIKAFDHGIRVGSKSPDALFGRIRDAIHKAAQQLRVERGSPCVAVLYNANSFVNLAPMLVGGAMFGDPAISVPIGGGESRTVFTGGRVLGDTKNTTLSAVAVLSRTNANQHLIDEVVDRMGPWEGPGLPPADRTVAVIEAISRLLEERPEAAVRVPYLTVHHNPHALVALPASTFQGPHDKHIRYER